MAAADTLTEEQLAELHEMQAEHDAAIEPDDEDPEDEPAPAATAEPSSLAVVGELNKKYAAETKRHENALAKLHPDDWDQFAMCPLCIGDGFLTPIPEGTIVPELWEAIKALAGKLEDGKFPLASYTEPCQTCDGWGMVRTGAKNDNQRALPCKACNGMGWRDKPGEPPALSVVPTGGTAPGGYTPPAPVSPVHDAWGRPAGHERFGIDIQFTGGTW